MIKFTNIGKKTPRLIFRSARICAHRRTWTWPNSLCNHAMIIAKSVQQHQEREREEERKHFCHVLELKTCATSLSLMRCLQQEILHVKPTKSLSRNRERGVNQKKARFTSRDGITEVSRLSYAINYTHMYFEHISTCHN